MKNFWTSKNLRVELLQADVPTFSKRIYPKALVERIVKETRPVLGHLDHQEDSLIHFSQVSHRVAKLELEGDKLMAEIEVLGTPAGLILKKLLDEGVKIVFAPAGIGGGFTNKEGCLVVGDSYKFITVNAVAEDGVSKFYEPALATAPLVPAGKGN